MKLVDHVIRVFKAGVTLGVFCTDSYSIECKREYDETIPRIVALIIKSLITHNHGVLYIISYVQSLQLSKY